MAASAFPPLSPNMDMDFAIDQFLHSDAFANPSASPTLSSPAMKNDSWPGFWNDVSLPASSAPSNKSPLAAASLSDNNNNFGFIPTTSASGSNAVSTMSIDPILVHSPASSGSLQLPTSNPVSTSSGTGTGLAGRKERLSGPAKAATGHARKRSAADMSVDMDSDDDEDSSPDPTSAATPPIDSTPNPRKPSNGKLPHLKFAVPQYSDKPPLEEYKKLSSKEKRQLRNKISARNFRHRRKEYITQLEEEVAERDSTIASLREEVDTLRTDNKSLRSDLDVLKSQWDAILAKVTSSSNKEPGESMCNLNPSAHPSTLGITPKIEETDTWNSAATPSLSPASSTSTFEEEHDHTTPSSQQSPTASVTVPADVNAEASTSATASQRRNKNTRSSISQPNVRKDLFAGRSSSSWGPGGFGGVSRDVGVHATWIPDLPVGSLGLDGKPTAFDSYIPSFRNFNPRLDGMTDEMRKEILPGARNHVDQSLLKQDAIKSDFISANNPYLLKPGSLEDYRSQLYQKLGHNVSGALQAKKDPSNAFPVGFRPTFFTTPSSSSSPANAALLSGKTSTSPTTMERQQKQQLASAEQLRTTSYVAGLAVSTLFSKLTSSFIDAFAGQPNVGQSSILTPCQMSAEKVADVLAGRAEVRIVMKSPTANSFPANSSTTSSCHVDTIDSINDQLAKMSVGSNKSTISEVD